jgi:hypothetical protein
LAGDKRPTNNSTDGTDGSSSKMSPLGIGLVAAGSTVGAAGIVGVGVGLGMWYRRRRAQAASDAQAKIEWSSEDDTLATSKYGAVLGQEGIGRCAACFGMGAAVVVTHLR